MSVRRIPSDLNGDVDLLYYQKMTPRPIYFMEVAMDDSYIILFFVREKWTLNNFGLLDEHSYKQFSFVEVRDACSFELKREIRFGHSMQDYDEKFHYLNGFIVVGPYLETLALR